MSEESRFTIPERQVVLLRERLRAVHASIVDGGFSATAETLQVAMNDFFEDLDWAIDEAIKHKSYEA